jgi:Tol biopolymer transport system component
MIMSKPVATLIAAATLTALTVAVPAQATTRGSQGQAHAGRIVWTQVLDDKFSTARLVSAHPDGSGLRVLTHPGPKQFDIDAAVSPDGSQVLFERDLPGRDALEMVGADGRGEHVVPVICANPCIGLDNPGWTPSGRHITFTRVLGPIDPVSQSARSAVLYIARPDGSDVRQLTPWRLDADVPDLSLAAHGPTKDLVVFETFGQGAPKGSEQDIATIPATCHPLAVCIGEIRYVTHNGAGPGESFNPSWSPGGSRIAFTSALFLPGKPPAGDIWTIRPDGRGRQQVSRSARFEFRPAWGR